MIRLTTETFTIDAAEGETPRRTISGIAVRYNTPAKVSDGTMVSFDVDDFLAEAYMDTNHGDDRMNETDIPREALTQN